MTPAGRLDGPDPGSTATDVDAEFARIVAELTRRGFLAGGLGSAALLGLAACGSSDGGADGSSSATADATRTISTGKGSVRVPRDPKRVACLDPGFSWQTLLEVGLTPVGLPVVVDSLVLPENLAKAAEIPGVLNDAGEPDLEKIAAVKPDLILASTGSDLDAIYPKLTAIAPVVAYAFDFPSDWVTLDRSYAEAVNRSAQLSTVTAQYDQQVARIKNEYGQVIEAQKWALITESSNQVYVWGPRSSAGPVLASAGAEFSSGAPGADSPFTQLSMERLDTLDDATVILYGAGTDGRPYADTSGLLEQPLFTRLPAARAGHVYPLPSWFAYCYQDALAQLDGLETACQALAADK